MLALYRCGRQAEALEAYNEAAGLFPNNVAVVDLFAAFQGRSGLLLIEKHGAGFNIHPTNAGYQVMTGAFSASMGAH